MPPTAPAQAKAATLQEEQSEGSVLEGEVLSTGWSEGDRLAVEGGRLADRHDPLGRPMEFVYGRVLSPELASSRATSRRTPRMTPRVTPRGERGATPRGSGTPRGPGSAYGSGALSARGARVGVESRVKVLLHGMRPIHGPWSRARAKEREHERQQQQAAQEQERRASRERVGSARELRF